MAITTSAIRSSKIAAVRMKVRRRGYPFATSARMPSAKAVSVAIAVPQPSALEWPALNARKIATGTIIPPAAATRGSAIRLRCLSSPMSISRLASSPATRKKKTMSPSLIQSRSVSETPVPPTRIDSSFAQKVSYELPPAFAQIIATSTAASSTTAPPDSVRR